MKGLYNPSEKKMLPRQDNIFFSMILFFLLHIMVANCLEGNNPQILCQNQNFQVPTQEREVTEGNPHQKKV